MIATHHDPGRLADPEDGSYQTIPLVNGVQYAHIQAVIFGLILQNGLNVPRHIEPVGIGFFLVNAAEIAGRSEEHTSELQSLMRISYAVFCLKKKTRQQHTQT